MVRSSEEASSGARAGCSCWPDPATAEADGQSTNGNADRDSAASASETSEAAEQRQITRKRARGSELLFHRAIACESGASLLAVVRTAPLTFDGARTVARKRDVEEQLSRVDVVLHPLSRVDEQRHIERAHED